jgi:hypothetical protein
MKLTTFTSGLLGQENIPGVPIHLGQGSDMDDWKTLVESTIDAIHVDSTNKAVVIEVTCAWEGKGRKRIVATGVDDFVVNEMRLSNIVDRVSRFGAVDFNGKNAEIARRLFVLMRGKEPSQSDLEWPALKNKLACIRDGSLCLLEIEPVYGATIMILATGFRLESVI